RCTCMSQSPGKTVMPSVEIRSYSLGTWSVATVPTRSMRSPRTSMTLSRRGGAPLPSMSMPPTSAIGLYVDGFSAARCAFDTEHRPSATHSVSTHDVLTIRMASPGWAELHRFPADSHRSVAHVTMQPYSQLHSRA